MCIVAERLKYIFKLIYYVFKWNDISSGASALEIRNPLQSCFPRHFTAKS